MGLGSLFKRNKKDAVEKCHITIDVSNCDGCEKCNIACPNNVFMIVDDISKVRDCQVCKSCTVCMAICPNDCRIVN